MDKPNFKNFNASAIEGFLEMYTSKANFKNPIAVANYANVIKEHFNAYTSFSRTFKEENKILTRARKHSNPRTLFPNLSDLWCPPSEVVGVSRANVPTNSVFYCSNDPGTTLFEIRPKIGDWITSIDVTVNQPILNMLVMGIDFRKFGIKEESLSELDKGINDFLEKQFKEFIPHNERHKYYKTAMFIEAYLKDNGGIAYPSRASNLKGWNFVFTKEFADNFLIFNRATVHEVINITSEFDFNVKCLYQANYINQYHDFVWETVSHCATHNISEDIYGH